jgi:BlaI family penicillinase repressor
MPRPKASGPTERELAILQVLWRRGPSTVREVHEELRSSVPVGYTTVLKIMQLMFAKGLVKRDESRHAHLYQTALGRDQVQTDMTRDFLDRVFGGSAMGLVERALSVKGASKEEIERVRELLREGEVESGEPDELQ